MRLWIYRGQHPLSAWSAPLAAEDIFFAWGSPPLGLVQVPCLSYFVESCWPEAPRVIRCFQSERTEVPVRVQGDDWSCEISIGRLFLCQKPLYKAIVSISSSSQLDLCLPFQGWIADTWFDGPVICQRQGQISDMVAMGPTLLWSGSFETYKGSTLDSFDWQTKHAPNAYKLSLIRAFTIKFEDQDQPIEFQSERWDLHTAAHMLLLRCRFKEQVLHCKTFPRTFAEGWKRLAQNLNYSTREWGKSQPEPARVINLDALWPETTDEALGVMMEGLQRDCPFLPAKLWQHLRDKTKQKE